MVETPLRSPSRRLPTPCTLFMGAVLLCALPGAAQDAPSQDSAAPAASEAPNAESSAAVSRIVRREHQALGTTVVALATATNDDDARKVAAAIESAFREIDRVDALLRDDAASGSEVARLNAAAGVAPVRLSPELFEILLDAHRMAVMTQGAFDPTFAALAPFWRFSVDDPPMPTLAPPSDGGVAVAPFVAGEGAGGPVAAPSDEVLAVARGLVDYTTLILDVPAKTAKLPELGQRVSLNGISKGVALRQAAARLEQRGVQNFILAAGGDLVVRGKKGDANWTIGVQDPRGPGHFAAFDAVPFAVMTSGDYEKYFFLDGKRMHHVIDPRTGRPARGLRSVTIVADDAIVADAFSTAVFVLGPKEGMRLVERTKGVEAILVTDKNEVKLSRGLRDRVRSRPPTDAP